MKSMHVISNNNNINNEHELSIYCIIYYYYLYIPNEKTEPQRGQVTYPRSHIL